MIKAKKAPRLSTAEAEEILQQVFLECYEDVNSIPVEQLEQYSNYRTEKLSLQRHIATVLLVAFLLVPMFFVAPRFAITDLTIGQRGLPVYTVEIKNWLPIYSVTAVLGNYSLPVYQQGKRTFTIEPTTNGNMTITVSLFSKQWASKVVEVTAIDDAPPVYLGSSLDDTTLYVYVKDMASGVDYANAYIQDQDGTITYPDDYDEAEGFFEIDEIPEDGVLYVPDLKGNVLTVTIVKQ